MTEFTYKWKLSDLDNVPKNGLKVFSCFACGGGSTMGYKMSGFDVIGANEIDPKMAEVYKINHNPKYLYVEDIRSFKLRKDLPEELYNLDILDGSPPCSSFSMAGSREKAWGKKKKFREGQSEQILDDLFFHFIDLAHKLQPKVVIAENVKGLLMGNAKGYVKQINELFKTAGYNVQLFLLNAATMGVPQKRERVFFICKRRDLGWGKLKMAFALPQITFNEIDEGNVEAKGVTNGQIEYWKKANPGESFSKYHPKGHLFGASRVHPKRPLNTIIGDGGTKAYHYKYPRELTTRELQLGGSYPLDYKFVNTNPKHLIGMSVPPLMMHNISREIHKQWFSNGKS